MNQQDTNAFKNSTTITKWTKWFLYLNILIAVISIASTSFEYKFLSDIKRGIYTSSELILADSTFNESLQGFVSIVQFLVFVISGVLILRWIYISSYNANQRSNSKMKFTPGWSIGWYFVPIFNLWKPYQVMKEIWKVSENVAHWEKKSVPSILKWWWFFWIIDGFFSKLSFQLDMKASGINELMRVDLVYLISDTIFIFLSFSLLTIIDKIYKMQISHHNYDDLKDIDDIYKMYTSHNNHGDFEEGDYKYKEFNEQDVSIAIQFSMMNNNEWELLHANLDKTKQFLKSSGWTEKDKYLFVWDEVNDDNLYKYIQLDYDSNDFPVLKAGFMSYNEKLDDGLKPLDALMINFDDESAFKNIELSIVKSLENVSTSPQVMLEFVLYELGGLVLDENLGKEFVENSGFEESNYIGFITKSDEADALFDVFMDERSKVAKLASPLFVRLSIAVLDTIMQKYSLGKYKYKNIILFLQLKGIDRLYHFTDAKNIESIIKNGGLYSWKGLEDIGLNVSLSSDELSRQLDTQKNLQDYIRLSFVDYHPMSTKVKIEDGKNLVWLEIDLDVVLWESTLFSDMNATDNNVTVQGDFDFLKNLDFDVFKQRYNNLDSSEKKKYQAEILVKDFLPIKYITNIDILKVKYIDGKEIPF